jgi:NAD(P)-dependent dehydrogenase (short-subunit alcohol dehydrogenase family)
MHDLGRLDIVINNAGVCKRSFALDPKTRHEESIQVSHPGNALFVILMIPFLQARSPVYPGCITFVSFDTPAWAEFKKESTALLTAFDKPQSFKCQDRYAPQSHSANCP